MTKVAHIADVHLRDTQYMRSSRGQDFFLAVMGVIRACSKMGIKNILAAGDIMESNKPSSTVAKQLIEIDAALQEYDMHMFAIPGDHDACTPSWMEVLGGKESLNRIYDVSGKVMELVPENKDSKAPTVFGVPHAKMHPNAFRELKDSWPKADILMYHGPLKDFAAFKMGVNDLSSEDMPTDKYQFIALGDLHARKYIVRNGCLIGYPGSTEYCTANEPTEKSFSVVEFDNKGKIKCSKASQVASVPIATRKVVRRKIYTQDQMESLVKELRECASENPIVQVEYFDAVSDAFERICQIVDPRKAIIQVSGVIRPLEPINLPESSMDVKRASDFVHEFAHATDPHYAVMVRLCESPESAGVELDRYIEDRLK